MTIATKYPSMTVGQFFDWAAHQPSGRYELASGKVVTMSPERNRHVDVKMEAWLALRQAVREAGLPLHVSGDGVTVVVDEFTAREPDVTVQTLPVDPDALTANEPVILVEVVSPSSEQSDTGAKLAEYFSIGSVYHYLIVDPDKYVVIHHRRGLQVGKIETSIVREGDIELSPPGIRVPVKSLLGEEER